MYPTNNLWIQATPEVAKKIFLIRSRVLYLHFWRIHDNFFWMGSATTSEKCIRCYSFYVVTTWTQMCKNWVRDSTVCPPRRQAVNYWAKNYLSKAWFLIASETRDPWNHSSEMFTRYHQNLSYFAFIVKLPDQMLYPKIGPKYCRMNWLFLLEIL